MAQDRPRHERWLHTRISEDLEDALKREARRRRSPVSMVVRNVLEGALDLVEEIVEDSLEVARHSRRFARRVSRATAPSDDKRDLDDIYGWQALILNRPASCAQCDSECLAGTNAHRGLRDRPGPPVFLCDQCIRRLRQPATRKEERGQ